MEQRITLYSGMIDGSPTYFTLSLQILAKDKNTLIAIPITPEIAEECKSFLDSDGKFEDGKIAIWITSSVKWASEEEYQREMAAAKSRRTGKH